MPAEAEKRRHRRFLLGLPVRVQANGLAAAITAELADVSQGGCLLKAPGHAISLGARVAFGFVMSEAQIVLASGQVVRLDGDGGFALDLQEKNDEFRSFLAGISGLRILAA